MLISQGRFQQRIYVPTTNNMRKHTMANMRKYGMLLAFRKKKTQNVEFFGYDEHWHKMFFLQLKWDLETEKCHMIKWYTCLHDRCEKHMEQKQKNGFFPQSGKNKSFMLRDSLKKKL